MKYFGKKDYKNVNSDLFIAVFNKIIFTRLLLPFGVVLYKCIIYTEANDEQ